MKKLLPLLLIVVSFACRKQISEETIISLKQDNRDNTAGKAAGERITICHNGMSIEINYLAWPAHQAHGDVLGTCPGYTTICGTNWMVKNLDVTTYRDGTPIPQVQDPSEWLNLTTGAWCYYDNDPANGPVYGKLYNWYAVNDPRGLAPAGWHIPSADEWVDLVACLGGDEVAGSALKETGTTHWRSPNTDATNSSGFTALPGGLRAFNFQFLGEYGSFWTSTESSPTNAWNRSPYFDNGFVRFDSDNKLLGLSVRCIKD